MEEAERIIECDYCGNKSDINDLLVLQDKDEVINFSYTICVCSNCGNVIIFELDKNYE